MGTEFGCWSTRGARVEALTARVEKPLVVIVGCYTESGRSSPAAGTVPWPAAPTGVGTPTVGEAGSVFASGPTPAAEAMAVAPRPPPLATHEPTTRSRPWRLERYIVVSAAIMRSSTDRPSRGYTTTP